MNNWTGSQNNHGRVGRVGAGAAMKKIVIATALLLSLTGCSSASVAAKAPAPSTTSPPATRFHKAVVDDCGLPSALLLNNDSKIDMTVGGASQIDVKAADVSCIMQSLLPDNIGTYLWARIGQTPAGNPGPKQDYESSGITFRWQIFRSPEVQFSFVDDSLYPAAPVTETTTPEVTTPADSSPSTPVPLYTVGPDPGPGEVGATP